MYFKFKKFEKRNKARHLYLNYGGLVFYFFRFCYNRLNTPFINTLYSGHKLFTSLYILLLITYIVNTYLDYKWCL